jgi:hypothetical protein
MCNNFLQQNNSAEAHPEIKKCQPKVYVYATIGEALSQVICRLPSARDTYETLSKLSPVIILNQISRPVLFELSFIHHVENNISKTEEKYRQMSFVDWQEEALFKKYGFSVDTEQFWVGVLQHKAFKELATFALTCLINRCQQCYS